MNNSETDKQNLPLFHLSERFPDARSIFSTSVPSLEEFKDEALIVVDTNVLLIPYEIQPKSLDEIKNTYQQLIRENRLFIPSQVVREFARNRGEKIKILHHNISLKQNVSVKIESYQLLESDAEYQELLKAEKELNQKIIEYRKIVGKVLEKIRSWRWNDPVSNLYGELFPPEIIIDLKITPEEIEKDLNRRFANKIAPGFKDAGKKDKGIGDVIIWNTILQLGKEHKKPIIFVSGDEKTDWMLRSNNEALYPNFELIEEYMRVSDGKAFHILKFSELLDLFGAKADVVEEIKKEEVVRQDYLFPELTVSFDVKSIDGKTNTASFARKLSSYFASSRADYFEGVSVGIEESKSSNENVLIEISLSKYIPSAIFLRYLNEAIRDLEFEIVGNITWTASNHSIQINMS